MRRRGVIYGAAFSILAGLSPEVKASATQQEKIKSLQHEVAVTLKLVQVYVTDRKGSPVTDLRVDDFELYDNGVLRKITDFEKHVLPAPADRREKVVETDAPPARAPLLLGRKFFLLIDFFQNDLQGIQRAKTAAQHFLITQLLPTDEVAILSYSPFRGLVVHEFLTPDHERAKAAISDLGKKGGLPFYGLDERNKAVLMREDVESDSDLDTDWIIDNTNKFSQTMKELAMSLRTIPGIKNIIFLSAGTPRSLAYDLAMDQEKLNGSIVLGRYQDMVKEFSASSCPVYSVNTEGTRAALKPRARRGTAALQQLAERSGGRYFHSGDSYEKVAETIQRITGNYYVLGYYIDEKWDGRYHELKINVKREGCQVSAQGGYFSAKPFAAYSEFEKQLHLVDLVMNKKAQFQSPFLLRIQALQYSFDEGENCLLVTEINKDEIREVVGRKCDVHILILDQNGQIADYKRGEVNLASLDQRKVCQYSFASLKTGQYDCRLVVRNLETGRAAVGTGELTVREPGRTGLDLFPPVLLIAYKESAYLRVADDKEKGLGEGGLSIRDIYPFIPADSSLLFEDLDEGVEKILAVLRCRVPNAPETSLKIAARLTDSTKNEIPVSYSLLTGKKEGRTWIFLMEIRFPELPSGEYVLTFSATETASQVVSEAARAIKVSSAGPSAGKGEH